jgi:hypothetical protein
VWFSILVGEAGIVLQLSDQKAQVFLVLIAFTRWFPEYFYEVFDEMPVRDWTNFWPDFITIISHVFLPASIRVSAVIRGFLT